MEVRRSSPVKVQDMLRKFERQLSNESCNRSSTTTPTTGNVSVQRAALTNGNHCKPTIVPRPPLATNLSTSPNRHHHPTPLSPTAINICTWSVRRRDRANHQQKEINNTNNRPHRLLVIRTNKTSTSPSKPQVEINHDHRTSDPISVSALTRIFQAGNVDSPDNATTGGSNKEKNTTGSSNNEKNTSGSSNNENNTTGSSNNEKSVTVSAFRRSTQPQTNNAVEELYADTLQNSGNPIPPRRGVTKRLVNKAGQLQTDQLQTGQQLPSGPPPRKPSRTFAHDIYMNNKLGTSNGVTRTHSDSVPEVAKPKLPPKPSRAKTVPGIGQRVHFHNRRNNNNSKDANSNNSPSRPATRLIRPTPPPSQLPVAPQSPLPSQHPVAATQSSPPQQAAPKQPTTTNNSKPGAVATSRWFCPRPWNVQDSTSTATQPKLASATSARMAAALAVMASSSPLVDSSVPNRMRNYALLKRSRSEERIYDVPCSGGAAIATNGTAYLHYDHPVRSCIGAGLLDRRKSPSVGSTSSSVLFVDNDLYARDDFGAYSVPRPRAGGTGGAAIVGNGNNGCRELHYMSSPIVTENRAFPEGLPPQWRQSHRNKTTTNKDRNDLDRCSAGSNTANMIEWRQHNDTKEARHKSFAYYPPCGANQECDVVNWSFASVYDTPNKKSSQKEDDSGDSDSDVSEKEVLKRIAYIHRISRGPSMRREIQSALPSYRKQFDAVLIVGLKYVENSDSSYHPYVKEIFPGPEAVECSVDEIAHFCFPDAASWKPAAERETYTFTLTNEKGDRLFGYCRRVKPDGVEYNIPIVYCIISPVLARSYYFQVLGELEKRHGLPDLKMRAFLQTLQARSVPQPGKTIYVKCPELEGDDQIIISRKYDFPLDNADTGRLLTQLSIPVLIKVFASLLLERRVLFMASKPQILTECIHALMALLHPFTWQHTFIPLLPCKMLDIISAPTPYVVGILSDAEPLLRDLPMEDTIFVDLESSQLLRQLGDENTIIPKKIHRALTTALKFIKHRPDDLESPNSTLVNEAFLRMFVELVGHYELHISCYPEGSRIFHCNSFSTAPTSHSVQMFLKWFTETQMFDLFIEKKTLPPETNTVDLFDQYIKDKLAEGDKPSLKTNVKEFSKKMRNFGEKLIGFKTPVKA